MILIVEDEISVCDILCEILKMSYKTISASNQSELLKINITDIKLVITDSKIQNITSDYVVDMFKETTVPIILMSGYDIDMIGKYSNMSNYVEFISKPFSISHVLKIVKQYYPQ